MNKDKKIATQERIVNGLRIENKELLERINKLEKTIADNRLVIELVERYRVEHEKTIISLEKAREEYLQAHKDMVEQKNMYKKEMEKLLQTIKKNT